MKVFIHALNSCGMRNVEVQQYRDFFLANGHEIIDNPDNSDLIFVWTCAFRGDVRDNSLSIISRYAEYEDKVIVGGCLPDIDPKLLGEHFKGKIINWQDDEKKFAVFGSKKLSEIAYTLTKPRIYDKESDFKRQNPNVDAPYVGRFIQLYISRGCNFRCFCCSERLAFPPYKSFPEDDIAAACVTEVCGKEWASTNKVVLLADSIGEYGYDIGSSLPMLISHLVRDIPNIKIGLQGLNPHFFIKYYDDFVEFIKSGRIIHLQIPLQSASDCILNIMNRPYTRDDIEKVFGTLNELEFVELDTHIIVGFPGETDEDLQESIDFVIRHHPKYVMVNRFMESRGIPASKLPHKVSEDVKKERALKTAMLIKHAGIICNYEDGDLSYDRFRRMNKF